MRTPLTAINC